MPRIDPPMIRPRVMGELIIGGPSGSPILLPVGAEGDQLTVAGGSPTWVAPTPIYTQAEVDTILSPILGGGEEGQVLRVVGGERVWTPEIHAYTQDEVDAELANYAEESHTHQITDVINLDVSLGERSLVGHTHNATEVTGITEFVANKTEEYLVENPPGDAVWGGITGTLSNQLDLQSAFDAKSDVHAHPYASDTHNHDSNYAGVVHTHSTADLTATGGTASSFLRKDNTWATPSDTNTTYSEITSAEITGGTATTLRTMTGRRSEEIVTKAREGMATTSHNHDASYTPLVLPAAPVNLTDATSAQYVQTAIATRSPVGHNHDSAYAVIAHNHDAVYAPLADNLAFGTFHVSPDGIVNTYNSYSSKKSAYFRGGLKDVSVNADYPVVEVAFAGTGTAKTAARSDHDHGLIVNRKSADTTTISAAAANVPDMSFNVGAGETWSYEMNLITTCNNTGGIKYAMTFPTTGTSCRTQCVGASTGVATITSAYVTGSGTLTSVAFNTVLLSGLWVRITGTILNGSNAGTVQLQFASSTSGQTSTVHSGSSLTARKVA